MIGRESQMQNQQGDKLITPLQCRKMLSLEALLLQKYEVFCANRLKNGFYSYSTLFLGLEYFLEKK